MLEYDATLAISQAADLQAAVHRDETGGKQRADAKHKALDAVPEAPGLSKHPGVTQADSGRRRDLFFRQQAYSRDVLFLYSSAWNRIQLFILW